MRWDGAIRKGASEREERKRTKEHSAMRQVL